MVDGEGCAGEGFANCDVVGGDGVGVHVWIEFFTLRERIESQVEWTGLEIRWSFFGDGTFTSSKRITGGNGKKKGRIRGPVTNERTRRG